MFQYAPTRAVKHLICVDLLPHLPRYQLLLSPCERPSSIRQSNLAANSTRHHHVTQIDDIWSKPSPNAWLDQAKPPLAALTLLWTAWSLINLLFLKSKKNDDLADQRDSWGRISPAERWASNYLRQHTSGESSVKSDSTHAQILCCFQSVEGAASLGFISMSGFFQKATEWYGSASGGASITGLMLAFPSCTLTFLEGDVSALCALLREVRSETANQHMMSQGRVVAFFPETSSRMFSSWYAGSAVPVLSSRKHRSKTALLDRISSVATMSEAEIVKSVEDMVLFLRLLAAKIEALPTEEEKSLLLEHFFGIEASIPSPKSVLDLATSQVAPTIQEFITEHDSEFHRFKAIASQGGLERYDTMLPTEFKRLQHLYQGHLDWEKGKEIEAESDAKMGGSTPLLQYYPRNRETLPVVVP